MHSQEIKHRSSKSLCVPISITVPCECHENRSHCSVVFLYNLFRAYDYGFSWSLLCVLEIQKNGCVLLKQVLEHELPKLRSVLVQKDKQLEESITQLYAEWPCCHASCGICTGWGWICLGFRDLSLCVWKFEVPGLCVVFPELRWPQKWHNDPLRPLRPCILSLGIFVSPFLFSLSSGLTLNPNFQKQSLRLKHCSCAI